MGPLPEGGTCKGRRQRGREGCEAATLGSTGEGRRVSFVGLECGEVRQTLQVRPPELS